MAVSANNSKDYLQRYIAAGINDHISKPIDVQQLWRVLEQHISKEIQHNHLTTHNSDLSEPNFSPLNLKSLHKSMGDTRFVSFINTLVKDYQTCLVSISQQNILENTLSVQDSLHDLTSTAGYAGFNQLSNLAQQLSQVLPDKDMQCITNLQTNIESTLRTAIAYLQEQINSLDNK
jgi:CheY-like chemotaxis protein